MALSLKATVESLGAEAGVAFVVVLPDGVRHRVGEGEPAFTLVFRSDRALMSSVARGHLGLLQAYFDQEVDLKETSARRNRLIEREVIRLGGIKSLYSDCFF